MFKKKPITQIVKSVPITLLLAVLACQESKPKPVKLDSALQNHFQLITEGKTGSARVQLRQFMEKQGESSHALFLMGLSYHNEKKYAKSVEWFTTCVQSKGSQYPNVWHFLGWSHYYLGQSAQALSCFETYLRHAPDEPDSLFALGLIAMEKGEFASAKKLFLAAMKNAESNNDIQAKVKSRLADVFVEEGNRERAIELYQDAVKQNPDLYEAWYRLTKVLQRVGKRDDSAIALQQFNRSRKRVRPELETTTEFPE